MSSIQDSLKTGWRRLRPSLRRAGRFFSGMGSWLDSLKYFEVGLPLGCLILLSGYQGASALPEGAWRTAANGVMEGLTVLFFILLVGFVVWWILIAPAVLIFKATRHGIRRWRKRARRAAAFPVLSR